MIEDLSEFLTAAQRIIQMHGASASQHEHILDALLDEDIGNDVGYALQTHARALFS
jgi:hypothetical protein